MKKFLPLSLAGFAACIPAFLNMSDSEMKGTCDGKTRPVNKCICHLIRAQ